MKFQFLSIANDTRPSDIVVQLLSAEIRSGRLTPSSRLPTEAQLIEQFQVSRLVAQEAIAQLTSLGLVNAHRGGGVFVVDAVPLVQVKSDVRHANSKEAVLHIAEARRGLDAEIAALAAQRHTPADIQAIKKTVQSLHKAVRAGGNGAQEDVQFHRAIAETARNPFLINTLEHLSQFMHDAMRVTRANEARCANLSAHVQAEHEAIVEAIEAGDASKARAAAARHMSNAIRRLEKADASFWQQEGYLLAAPLVSALLSERLATS